MKLRKRLTQIFTLITLITLFPYSLKANDCVIGEVFADPTECEEGTFFVWLTFEYENVSNAFKVVGNGNNYGVFEYEDLPVLIGPLEGDGVTIYEFVVIDMEFEECSNWTAIDPIDCEGGGGDCAIWDVYADPTECENGMFWVWITFEYENVSNTFAVAGNGNEYGIFEYEDLPILIGPLEGDGVAVYEFVVFDLEFIGCTDWTAIDPIDCEGGGNDCEIGELIIDDHPCEEGMFYVYFDFEHVNTSEYFHVYANNIYFGAFEYSDLPLDLGPLEGDGETVYNFHVIDGEDPSCHRWKPFGPIDCEGGGGDCIIGELWAEFIECDDEGYYWVLMNFEYSNVSEEGFKFFLNDELFGVYGYEELPIEVGPLAGDGQTQYDFYVRDIVYEDCSNWRWIGPEECEGWGGECNIWDVVAEVLPCTGNNFNVMINFEFENVGDNGFKIVGNGNNYGIFGYEEVPITIGPFEGDGVTAYEFAVIDLTYEGCSDWTEIEPVDCGEVNFGDGISEDEIKVFPNPAKDKILITLPDISEEGYDLFVYNNYGSLIDKRDSQHVVSTEVDLKDYTPGIYFVKIVFNSNQIVIKGFIKE